MKKGIILFLILGMLFSPSAKLSASELGIGLVDENMAAPRSSMFIDSIVWEIRDRVCYFDVFFVREATGSITATLQKKSGSSWIDVTSTYITFHKAFAIGTRIELLNIASGEYRIKFVVFITENEYQGTTYTGSQRV